MSDFYVKKFEAMKKFSKLSTEDMYKALDEVRKNIEDRQELVENFAKSQGIELMFKTPQNQAYECLRVLGFYLKMQFILSTDTDRARIWKAVKQEIPYVSLFYTDQLTIGKDHIKFKLRLNMLEKPFKLKLIKHHACGSCKYEATESALYMVHIIQTIIENFKGN